MQKPSIPKGTRDFNPVEMARRSYIFETIKSVFQLYGYQQIETPAMEQLNTLLGKYGDEGDKLLFKIVNSGDFLGKAHLDDLKNQDSAKVISQISEKGLRYDLTVPFARFVVQHQNEISFPFKRYQIQPVWRADRPQKGRYREFYQCDADVIGSKSLLNEYELLCMIEDVFQRLGIKITSRINNRKVLFGIAEVAGIPDQFMDITIAIDKLDKIGPEAVLEELKNQGLPQNALDVIRKVIERTGVAVAEQLEFLNNLLTNSETGLLGVSELQEVYNYALSQNKPNLFEIDLSLARGLNYYTGCIIEVSANDVKMGSICGGGRYDDLTGIFGLKDVSGVGISFGADRIYDVLNELKLFPESAEQQTKALILNFGEQEAIHGLEMLTKLRQAGVAAELFPDPAKLKKQMNYANKRNIPFVIFVGASEIEAKLYQLKNMTSGEQQNLDISGIIEAIKKYER